MNRRREALVAPAVRRPERADGADAGGDRERTVAARARPQQPPWASTPQLDATTRRPDVELRFVDGLRRRDPRSPFRLGRLLITAFVALFATAWGHLPADFALPAGTALCIDATSVRSTITATGGDRAAAAEAKAVAAADGGLDRVLAAFGRERWHAEACTGSDAYLRIDLTGRLLDPERYRGFDPDTYSLTWSVRVGRHAALEGPRAEADDVLLALSGSSLHSEERSDESVEQRLAGEGLTLATEVVHAAVLAGDGRWAAPRTLVAVVLVAVLAALAMGVVAVRRRRQRRDRSGSDRRAARDPSGR